jgi:Fe-coproporphyrin III synthase
MAEVESMISITRLLNGSSYFGDSLRFSAEICGQITGASAPAVVWTATRTCNLNCTHCDAIADRRKFPGELTTDEAKALIDDLAASHVPTLLISGGEPLVRPDMIELIAYASGRGLRVTFSTNGTLITEAAARALREAGVEQVGIAIGGSEETHDRLRNRKGSWREAVEGIRILRKEGLGVGIRFTITGANIDDLGEVFSLAQREEVDRLFLYHLVYSDHSDTPATMDLTTHETRFVMDAVIDQAEQWLREDRPIEVLTADNGADGPYVYLRLIQKDPSRAEKVLELLRLSRGNQIANAVAAIDSYGNVHPDQFTQNHTLGSVRERRFAEIWSHPADALVADMRDRRSHLKGRCSTCLWVDVCNGNYRTRAEAASGDFWESDPACYLLDSEIAPDFLAGAD